MADLNEVHENTSVNFNINNVRTMKMQILMVMVKSILWPIKTHLGPFIVVDLNDNKFVQQLLDF